MRTAFWKWANRTIRSTSRIQSYINERSGEAPSTWQESTPRQIYGLPSLYRGNLERRLTRCTCWCITGERRVRSLCKKNQNKRSSCAEKRWQLHISLCRRFCKVGRKGFWSLTIRPNSPRYRKRRRIPQRSSRRTGWTGVCSISGSFIYLHHIQERQNDMCLKKDQFLIHWTYCRTENWWLLTRSWRPETIRTMDQFHSIHNTESEYVQTWVHVARSMVKHVKEFSAERKTDKRKVEARQCQKIEMNSSYCSGRFGIWRNLKERSKKIGLAWGVSIVIRVTAGSTFIRRQNS